MFMSKKFTCAKCRRVFNLQEVTLKIINTDWDTTILQFNCPHCGVLSFYTLDKQDVFQH